MTDALFFIELHSHHYSWSAFGKTAQGAIDAMIAGLRKHGRAIDHEEWWVDEWTQEEMESSVRLVKAGAAYRDGEPI